MGESGHCGAQRLGENKRTSHAGNEQAKKALQGVRVKRYTDAMIQAAGLEMAVDCSLLIRERFWERAAPGRDF